MRFQVVVANHQDCDRDAIKRLLRRLIDLLDKEEVSSGVITDLHGKSIGKFEINNET